MYVVQRKCCLESQTLLLIFNIYPGGLIDRPLCQLHRSQTDMVNPYVDNPDDCGDTWELFVCDVETQEAIHYDVRLVHLKR